jgi:hypothetical protein
MGTKDRRSVNLVIVDVDNRSGCASNALCECDIEEQTAARRETAETNDRFVSYAVTVQGCATNIPRRTSGMTRTSINTVNALARVRENNVVCGNTRDGKLSWIHLDEDVEAVEKRHTRDVDPKVN